MRRGAVAALALDLNVKPIAGSHHWAVAAPDRAHRIHRPQVRAIDGVHARPARARLEHARLDHLARAAEPLLGRLKHELDYALE